MRPIYKMKVIQIEVTNACVHSCSNCTRFCGHFKKPFFMDYDTFAAAVDSMEGFPGMVGIMGGEPTLHPEFEKIVKYYRSKIEPGVKYKNALKPIKNFGQYLIENNMQNIREKRGLWSSLGAGYYKNFELIQETFPFQLINDHSHSGLHQTLLVTRKELGIPDEKWIKMRDNCWAQNLWSASITPKGCFFCEVAAALDMLFDGPGGWPIEKGWWKRRPEDFGEQLNWCEYCSAVLNVPRVEASMETDVVSPVIYEKLKALGSPKVSRGKVKVFPVEKYNENKLECDYSSEWYLPSGDNTKRVACTNKSLYPKKLEALIINSASTAAPENIFRDLPHFDNAVIADFTGELDINTFNNSGNLTILDCAGKTYASGIEEAFGKLEFKDWAIFLEADTLLAENFRETFLSWIFNPGCLYCFTPRGHELKNSSLAFDATAHVLPFLFMLVNKNSSHLRAGEGKTIHELLLSWPEEKKVLIENLRNEDTEKRLELLSKGEKQKTAFMTEHILTLWRNLNAVQPSIALFGAGNHTKWLLSKLSENKLPMPEVIFDDDPDSNALNGVPVVKPEKYKDFGAAVVVVSSDAYSLEMTERALTIWKGEKLIVINPYSDFPEPCFQK